jgi:hypothetical protein
VRFEWDESKSAANRLKHGVSFDSAIEVFADPLIFEDHGHSEAEDRYVAIGLDEKGRLLTVCFTRPAREVIGVISARPATKRESEMYSNERRNTQH